MAQMVKEDKLKALDAALGQIGKTVRQRLCHEIRRFCREYECRDRTDRLSESGYRPGNGRSSKGKDHRDLWTGIQR